MPRLQDFDKTVPLPTGLTHVAIRNAIQYLEKELAELVELYYEQANVFSAIVGIFGTKALDSDHLPADHINACCTLITHRAIEAISRVTYLAARYQAK